MKNIYKLITVIIFTFLSVGSVFAADITADELVYDSQTKTVSVTGNVVINDGESTITGASGKYDFNDKTAILSGGVNYTKNQDTLSCETLYIYSDKTINGKGNVELDFKSENIFLSGDEISYNQNTGIGQINGNGYFKSQRDNTCAANRRTFERRTYNRKRRSGNNCIHSKCSRNRKRTDIYKKRNIRN